MRSTATFGNLAVGLALALVLFSSGSLLWNTYSSARRDAERARGEVRDNAQTLARVLQLPMWNVDRPNIRLVCTFYLENKAIQRIEVTGVSGEAFFDQSRDEQAEGGENLLHTIHIRHEGEDLGILRLHATVPDRDGMTVDVVRAMVIFVVSALLCMVLFWSHKERSSMARQLAVLNRDLESQVQRRTRELMDKRDELEAANAQLRRLDELKSEFLSSVAHELRTPMTSVYGFTRLIDKDLNKHVFPLMEQDERLAGKAERIQRNLDTIVGEGERLTRLINDVLDLTKIEVNRMEWRDRPVDMGGLLHECARLAHGFFVQKQDVDLRVELEEDLPVLQLDSDRLTQVLLNLLHNAAKFTEKGHVLLCAGKDRNAGCLRVRIADTGPGIPEEHLQSVFDQFHRTGPDDIMEHEVKGSGLGLAICKQIVEHYGGRIWAESESCQGAAIVMELPLAIQAAAPTA